MKSESFEYRPSEREVTNMSTHGNWLFSNWGEMFLSYQDFPWFKDAPVGKILHGEEPSPNHSYWPDNDKEMSAIGILDSIPAQPTQQPVS